MTQRVGHASEIAWDLRSKNVEGPIVAVGGDETNEFRRQSKDFSNLWQSRGWKANYLECRDLNHFNAPLELCKSNSQMTEELLAMIN